MYQRPAAWLVKTVSQFVTSHGVSSYDGAGDVSLDTCWAELSGSRHRDTRRRRHHPATSRGMELVKPVDTGRAARSSSHRNQVIRGVYLGWEVMISIEQS